jgi:hypothetical protein
MKTKIVFILDRSGSMGSLTTDVIGGFNQFLKEQKEVKGKASLTVVLFDDMYELLMEDVDIQDVNPITEKEYFVRGRTTALLDAVGKTINTVKANAKKRDKVLFFINTDGIENASHEFTNPDVKALVEETKKLGWNYVFLGANIDSFAVGGAMGIKLTASYTPSSVGTQSLYYTMSSVTKGFRSSSRDLNENDLKGIQ